MAQCPLNMPLVEYEYREALDECARYQALSFGTG